MTPVLFVLVAAIASMLRWLTIDAMRSMRGGSGTIAVNVAGSFLLGLAVGLEIDQLVMVGVAGLGSFTTFSTMALDVTRVPRDQAIGYLVTTLVLGLLAAWLGLQVGG